MKVLIATQHTVTLMGVTVLAKQAQMEVPAMVMRSWVLLSPNVRLLANNEEGITLTASLAGIRETVRIIDCPESLKSFLLARVATPAASAANH